MVKPSPWFSFNSIDIPLIVKFSIISTLFLHLDGKSTKALFFMSLAMKNVFSFKINRLETSIAQSYVDSADMLVCLKVLLI